MCPRLLAHLKSGSQKIRKYFSGIFNDFGSLVSWMSGFQFSLIQKVWGSNTTKCKWSKLINCVGPAACLRALEAVGFLMIQDAFCIFAMVLQQISTSQNDHFYSSKYIIYGNFKEIFLLVTNVIDSHKKYKIARKSSRFPGRVVCKIHSSRMILTCFWRSVQVSTTLNIGLFGRICNILWESRKATSECVLN